MGMGFFFINNSVYYQSRDTYIYIYIHDLILIAFSHDRELSRDDTVRSVIKIKPCPTEKDIKREKL